MPNGPAARAVIDVDHRYQLPGLQPMTSLSGLVLDRAKGPFVWDLDGRRYLDFFTGVGVCAIGHGNPHFLQVVGDQLRRVVTGTYSTEVRSRYLRRLVECLPDELRRVQLYSTGSEAVEAALRLARAVTGRFEVLSFWGGFHGKTLGSLSLHGGTRKAGWGPLLPGVHQTPYAHCYRCPFGLTHPACELRCVEFIPELLDASSVGSLAAIVVEPVQGTSGNIVPPPGFLEGVARVARQAGALLIVDEVITGFGRTGSLFAFRQLPGVLPDILVLGKAMASGVPMSAIVVREALLDRGSNPFTAASGASTFGGNPLACAAALATLEVIEADDLVGNARRLAEVAAERLAAWPDLFGHVGQVHQAGLMLGVELVADQRTRAPLPRPAAQRLFTRLLDAGLLAMAYDDRVRLYPPISITQEQLEEGLSILEQALGEVTEQA